MGYDYFYDTLRAFPDETRPTTYSLPNLPKDADIEETVKAFLARVERGDFSPPGIVRKSSEQIIFDRIRAVLKEAGLPHSPGMLEIFKPKCDPDEKASEVLRDARLDLSYAPIVVCVGTTVDEYGVLDISGETSSFSGFLTITQVFPCLIFNLSAIAPNLPQEYQEIKMRMHREFELEEDIPSAYQKEQFPLIVIYEADGEMRAAIMQLKVPEIVLRRAMQAVEPVVVAEAAIPSTPVRSSGTIYLSEEGKKHPKATQREIEERRRSEGKVIHGKKGTRKKGEGNRKPRGRTKTRRTTEWGGGGRGHRGRWRRY